MAVRKGVTISHRGARYELGRGRGYYAIWGVGSPDDQPPLQWWHDTPEGRSAAWQRFTELEEPGAVVAVGAAPAGRPHLAGPAALGARALVAVALIGAGILFGIIGLFPGYFGSSSLASQADELVPHLIYLAGWLAAAIIVGRGRAGTRAGALLGIGVGVVTFGMFLSDVGIATSSGSGGAGPGLTLSVVGWVLATAGSAAAFAVRDPFEDGATSRQWAPAVTLMLAAVGAAIAFAPSWDRFVLTTATGASQTITEGNAFSNTGLEITGDVAVMIAIVAVAVAAGLWRQARQAAALLAGATIPLLAQAVSALVQIGQGASAAQFGFSPAAAARLGLQVSSGLTLAFWVYCAFVVALALSCALLATTPPPGAQPQFAPPPASPAGPDLSASVSAS